ncbi:MAG: acetyl-CoA acetyltransferase [Polyangiaceae bacterium]
MRILGGYQTDFARRYDREGLGLADLLGEATFGALEDAAVEPGDLEVAHVGNFVGELFSGQGQLGGLLVALDPALSGLPTARHEAACASGSVALLAAGAELEATRYDVALVVGVEQMRHVAGQTAAEYLGAAAWTGREATEATFLWPALFSEVADVYDRRHGLPYDALMRWAEHAFTSAKRNPRAQARQWTFDPASFTADDGHNPVIEGRIRKQDCGQITDGASAVVVASERYATSWAERRGRRLDEIPRIAGWGHRTATMRLADKVAASEGEPHLFPHLRGTLTDAWRRAELGLDDIDTLEIHDCFTITAYAILDHLGLAPPGQAHRLIADGDVLTGGKLPVNPSGGLIGAGHPVGATGVRMVLDAARQVSGRAGDYQVDGARCAQTLNIGGSATTTVSFVVTRG